MNFDTLNTDHRALNADPRALRCERNLRAWLFDGKPVAAVENGGDVVRWMRYLSEGSITALREEAEKALEQKREEYRLLGSTSDRGKAQHSALLESLRQATADEDLLKIAKALRDNLLNEPKVPTLSAFSGYLSAKIGCFNGNHKIVREERRREAQRLEQETERLKREAEREKRREAEYALLLAQGRKSRTLQQAYANGDFIPMDDSEEPPLRSSTGHRLGSRG